LLFSRKEKVSGSQRCESLFLLLTYGLPIFCHVCAPFVGSDDQRLSYCVTNVVVVLPPLPTD